MLARSTRSLAPLVLVAAAALTACSAAPSGQSSAAPMSAPSRSSSSALVARWTGPALTTRPMTDADKAEVDTMAAALLASAKGQLDGIWLGVWSPEKGTMTAAYGNADAATGRAAVTQDRGRIGSVTKSIVATLVLDQVAAGTLSKTDTISDVLPGLAATHPLLAGVTIEQLLTMTSGIPDYTEVPGGMNAIATDSAYAPTPEQLVATAMAGVTALGVDASYSNTNYILLGLILEKVVGRAANEQVNSVLARLDMTDSSMPVPGDNVIPAPASMGYNHDGGVRSLKGTGVTDGPSIDSISSWGWTAGSTYSTVSDLATWVGTGLGSTLLPVGLAQERIAGAQPINGGRHVYSEGLQDFGNGWIGHEGQAVGWETIAAYNTRTGAAWVSIVNETTANLSMATIQQKFFPDLTDGEFIQPMMAAQSAAASPSAG